MDDGDEVGTSPCFVELQRLIKKYSRMPSEYTTNGLDERTCILMVLLLGVVLSIGRFMKVGIQNLAPAKVKLLMRMREEVYVQNGRSKANGLLERIAEHGWIFQYSQQVLKFTRQS